MQQQAECGAPAFLEAMGRPNASPVAVRVCIGAMFRAMQAIREKEAALRQEQICYVTPDQYRVLGPLARGLNYEEIAQELDLATSAVRNLIHRAYKAMGVSTKTQALGMYERELVLERPAKSGPHWGPTPKE